MANIRCPHCGSPAMVRGRQWECGWCGDSGWLPADRTTASVQVTVAVTVDEPEEPKCRFSRAELEDMVRRWDFSENERACRDLLLATFPEAADRRSAEELDGLDLMDLLEETRRRDPETALRMAKLLLDTAEAHLRSEEAAQQLLGWDLYDLLVDDGMLPLLVETLKTDDRLARQLFQSAYVDRPQAEILNACGRMGERELQEKLLALLAANPFPHDEIELESDEVW